MSSRDDILHALRIESQFEATAFAKASSYVESPIAFESHAQRIAYFSQMMQAVHTQVHHLKNGDWLTWLNQELPKRNWNRIIAGDNEIGHALVKKAQADLSIRIYRENVESLKTDLFSAIDVGITSCVGAITQTGSLVLTPSVDEPRLISLVSPVHIALLHSSDLVDTFSDLLKMQQWQKNMPTNALLISGPSKTADIQQVLAYGVHGPRELVVLILSLDN